MRMNHEMNFFLGLKVKQSPQGTFIHQEKYTSKFLKKYWMDNCALSKVPISFEANMSSDIFGESIDQKTYIGMIGSLLYLTSNIPDIMFATCQCSWY